jgi:RimJ/RimL family protein N-acetyltransferase
MTFEKQIIIEGIAYTVVMSDERETLLAAQAAGRVIVGLLHEDRMDADLSPAKYVYLMNSVSCEKCYVANADATDASEGTADSFLPELPGNDSAVSGDTVLPELPDDEYLGRVIRRTIGLPWIIAESPRLLIREFTMDDLSSVMHEDSNQPDDAVFYTPDLLQAYIREQYGYYECGMWAVIRKSDNQLIGKAGFVPESDTEVSSISGSISDLDINPVSDSSSYLSTAIPEMSYALGYHIFTPFRRQGYAKEACRLILHYLDEEFDGQAIAYVLSDNIASIRLLEQLGFQLCLETPDSLSAPETPAIDTQRCTQVQRLRYRHAQRC